MRPLHALAAALLALTLAGGAARAAEDHPPTPAPVPMGATQVQQQDSIAYAQRIQNGNLVGMTQTNYGFIGTNFSSFAPSFEYPLGSGLMHMVRGGPWIGALSADENGAFIGVSVACEDGGAGSNSAGSPDYRPGEFTPANTYVGGRSTLTNSRYYDPQAISEMDFISSYSDLPADPRKKHRPLNVLVNQYEFEWSFSDYAHFIIFHYVIHNEGPPLRNVWFGMYDELASGNMRLQSQYPPVGWFSKKYITWVDSLNMVTEHFCQSHSTTDNTAQCGWGLVPALVGVKLLGVHPGSVQDTSDKKVTFASWTYAPASPARDLDSLKYQIMTTGQKQVTSPLPDSLAPVTGDPVTLLAVGPFKTINPGDSVSVDFAYVGAALVPGDVNGVRAYADLAKRAITAQRAYDLDYIVPVPPPSPRLRVVARQNALDLYWDNSSELFQDPTSPLPDKRDFEGYRVYLGEARDTLNLLAQYDLATPPHDTTGFNTGLAPVAHDTTFADGSHYDYLYRIPHLRDGFKYYAAVTSYDLGTKDIESLESGYAQNEVMAVPAPGPGEVGSGVTVFPNPYKVEAAWDRGSQARQHYLWFTNLPARCKIQIFTLSGDLIFTTEFDGATYQGANATGIAQSATGRASSFSGTTFGWDMITRQGQAIATGLYLWAVQDEQNGKRQTGKVLVIKSDRESF